MAICEFTHDKVTDEMSPEVETLLQRLTLTPTKDNGKKRLSKEISKEVCEELHDLSWEAQDALKWLKNDLSWINTTRNVTPEEWLKDTNERLSKHRKVQSLQQLLLWLHIP